MFFYVRVKNFEDTCCFVQILEFFVLNLKYNETFFVCFLDKKT